MLCFVANWLYTLAFWLKNWFQHFAQKVNFCIAFSNKKWIFVYTETFLWFFMLQKKLNLVVLRIDKKQHFKMITFKSQKLILLLEYDEVVFYLYHVRKKRSKRKKRGDTACGFPPCPLSSVETSQVQFLQFTFLTSSIDLFAEVNNERKSWPLTTEINN